MPCIRFNECFDEKKTVEERNENLDHDLDKKLADLVNLQGANVSFQFKFPAYFCIRL